MGLAERVRSMKQAFQVVAPRLVANRRLLLIDDVLTTGSTANEAARTLLEGGAREVALLTISRVQRLNP
jgi:predicted amidophosphoribosyltransferase